MVWLNANSHISQADDELEAPYLAGFEWDREECYTKFIVHQTRSDTSVGSGGGGGKKGKKGKKGAEEGDE